VKAQTIPQILRCLTLGRYTARVVDDRLDVCCVDWERGRKGPS